MNTIARNNPSSYPFDGRHVDIRSDAREDANGLLKKAVFIDGKPLAIRRRKNGGYYSAFNFYQAFPSLQATANAAVIALRGRQLAPLQGNRIGKLPPGLPDLNDPDLEVRTRKNILRMPREERDLFVNAVLALKNRENINGKYYDEMVKVHMDSMNSHHWSAHGNALLPWHRLYVYHFESLLRAQPGFRNVTVPYWDWTETAEKDVLPFTDDFMGGGGVREEEGDNSLAPAVFSGPFAYRNGRWNTVRLPSLIDPEPPIPALERLIEELLFGRSLNEPTELQRVLAIDRYVAPDGGGFGAQVNIGPGLHNAVHNGIGGDMGSDGSPNDPIFWLHHCMLDKVWADWQGRYPDVPHYEKDDSQDHPTDPNAPLEPWLTDLGRNITPNELIDYKKFYIYE